MTSRDDEVLVWAPRGRDGELAVALIRRHGLRAVEIDGVDALLARILDAGCAVIMSDVLTPAVREAIAAALATQPPWSDFPVVLFGPRGFERAERALAAVRTLGNVALLERPVHGATLITALTAALRARRRQYDARDAIVRRDQFLAMLGHELRNPLAAIMLAVETMPAATGDERHRGIIERHARHLSRLVDDLLDVARVTSGKVRLRTEHLDLNEIVVRCAQGAELAGDVRGVALTLQLADEPLRFEGDLIRIEEILNNLISNALKYSLAGSEVCVTTRREGGACVVEVADRGIGIAPEMLDRVFDLFAQVDSSLDRSRGGLGIGLTLVKSLVELHRGTVRAASPGLGKGSTFTVELPASSRAGAPAPRAVAPAHADPAIQRVLLVDDNHDLLEMTRDLLETMDCQVAISEDGAEGLAKLIDAPPEVAFIDIGLPTKDGYTIAAEARARGVTSYLVAMTGYGQPEDQQRGLAAGFDLHLTKPVSVQRLREALAAAQRAQRA